MIAPELPLYQCHKQVRAVKIYQVMESPSSFDPAAEHGGLLFYEIESQPGSGKCLYVPVSEEYLKKHQPQAGGYYVRYADGYESYSPAGAFEDGYQKLHEGSLFVWHLTTESGKRFEILSDKPIVVQDTKILDAHEVNSFDWQALQRLRKAGT